jgi:hypothetical protein
MTWVEVGGKFLRQVGCVFCVTVSCMRPSTDALRRGINLVDNILRVWGEWDVCPFFGHQVS